MNELYHYGIPGMKWGIRRKREIQPDRIGNRGTKIYNKKRGMVFSNKGTNSGRKSLDRFVNTSNEKTRRAFEKELQKTHTGYYKLFKHPLGPVLGSVPADSYTTFLPGSEYTMTARRVDNGSNSKVVYHLTINGNEKAIKAKMVNDKVVSVDYVDRED